MARCPSILRAGSCLLIFGLVVWNGVPDSVAPFQLQRNAAALSVQTNTAMASGTEAGIQAKATEVVATPAPERKLPVERKLPGLPSPLPSVSWAKETRLPPVPERAAPKRAASERAAAPSKCVAEFLDPPCDMFKLIEFGMSQWRDKQVRPEQVDLLTSFTEDDRKEALVASYGGRLYMAYRDRRDRLPDAALFQEVMDLLAEIAAQVSLDVEFVIHTSDIPVVPKSADKVCGHKDRFVFSTAGGPLFCDVAMGPGVRSAPGVRMGNQLRTSDIAYEQKVNRAFWRGSPWPARRCGKWQKSPRILMPKASVLHPDVLNASVSKTKCSSDEPAKDLCREVSKMQPHLVPFAEQLKYRFLLTSAPKCTYTGRVYSFLASNSVVAMFSNGRHGTAQALYAALQDDVHVKLVHENSFVDEIRRMQASWKELAALPPRAQEVFDWATRRDTSVCYMYELLRAYRTKLAYKPSSDGTLARLLKGKTSACSAKSYVPGAEAVRADKGGRSYCIESWPVPSNASSMGPAAFREWCAQVRDRAPKF